MSKNYDSFGGNTPVISKATAPWEIRLDWSASDGRWRYTVYGDQLHPKLKRTGEMIKISGTIVNSHILTVTGRDEANRFKLKCNMIRQNGAYQKFHVSRITKFGAGEPHRFAPGAWLGDDGVKAKVSAAGMNPAFTHVLAINLVSYEAQPWDPEAKKNLPTINGKANLKGFCQITGYSWGKGFATSAKEAGLTPLNVESLFTQTEAYQVQKTQFGSTVTVSYPKFSFPKLSALAEKDQDKADAVFKAAASFQKEVNDFLDDQAAFYASLENQAADAPNEYQLDTAVPHELTESPTGDPEDTEPNGEGEKDFKSKTQKAIAKAKAAKVAKAGAKADVVKIETDETEEDWGDDLPF